MCTVYRFLLIWRYRGARYGQVDVLKMPVTIANAVFELL
jgi:hypothetical protein